MARSHLPLRHSLTGALACVVAGLLVTTGVACGTLLTVDDPGPSLPETGDEGTVAPAPMPAP
jgi:hypothetical protein